MLSREQLKVISAILADLGQVCIASVVVPFLVPAFIQKALSTIILGSFLAVFFWTLSILSVKSI